MRFRKTLICMAAAGLLLGAASLPSAGSPISSAVAAAPQPARYGSQAQAHRVSLVTGEQVQVTAAPDGRQVALVLPGGPAGGDVGFQQFRLGADLYLIPLYATASVGSTLDPALFDVTRLQALATTNGGRIPVRLTYPAGGRARAVPGVTLTTHTESAATGYLTARSAVSFGRALYARIRAGGQNRTAPDPLAGISRISLDGPAAPVSTSPNTTTVKLTVNGIDADGAPADDTCFMITNMDNSAKYNRFGCWSNGTATLQVPVGHYTVSSLFDVYDGHNHYTFHIVEVPDFTVSKARTITLDARTSTSLVSVSTPKPTELAESTVLVGRQAVRGPLVENGIAHTRPATVYVTPTRSAKVGQLHYFANWRRVSPAGHGRPYLYDVQFPADGAIPADQHYHVTPGQLATVRASYATQQAQLRRAADARISMMPWQTNGNAAFLHTLKAPLRRTEYVIGNPGIAWLQAYWSNDTPPDYIRGQIVEEFRSYRAGQSLTPDWLQQPIHPGVLVDFGAQLPHNFAFVCPACREADNLNFRIFPFGDNEPGHVGQLDYPPPGGDETESTSFTLLENGNEVASGTDPAGSFPVSPEPATYRLAYDNSRTAPWWSLSTHTHTVWTFHSSHDDGGRRLPPGWVCGFAGGRSCSVVPLLMTGYNLPTNMRGYEAAGPTRMTFTISHVQASPALPISRAHLDVSFDDGATWTPATVRRLAGGTFSASYTNPGYGESNGYVAMRLDASDIAGNRIRQTVTRAYSVITLQPSVPQTPTSAMSLG